MNLRCFCISSFVTIHIDPIFFILFNENDVYIRCFIAVLVYRFIISFFTSECKLPHLHAYFICFFYFIYRTKNRVKKNMRIICSHESILFFLGGKFRELDEIIVFKPKIILIIEWRTVDSRLPDTDGFRGMLENEIVG